MERLRSIIEEHATGRKVLVLFVLTNLIYASMLLITIPKTMSYADGMKLLDMMPLGFDVSYVNSLFESLGEPGRSFYLSRQIPLDMLYPILFAISYSLLIGYFLKKLNKLEVPFIIICILPLVAGIADYLENTGIIYMLLTYPDFPSNLVSITSIFSIIKSMSTTLYFIGLILTLFFLGLGFFRRTLKKQTI